MTTLFAGAERISPDAKVRDQIPMESEEVVDGGITTQIAVEMNARRIARGPLRLTGSDSSGVVSPGPRLALPLRDLPAAAMPPPFVLHGRILCEARGDALIVPPGGRFNERH